MMALLNYFHNLWCMSATYILSQFDMYLEYLGGGLKLGAMSGKDLLNLRIPNGGVYISL